MAIVDSKQINAIVQMVVAVMPDMAMYSDDGLSSVRDLNHDRLIFRLRPHPPDEEGHINAIDLRFGAQAAADKIMAALHDAAARARGKWVRDMLANKRPVDWIGDGSPDELLVRIETLMIALAQAEVEIRAAANRAAGL